ncbi:MAG: AAA family ATPase [Candidatus Omnitrophota bacterium]|jgi:general secretion pathway protein A
MGYYKVLGFQKEPFSTSPDPDFFYLSKAHDAALTNILIELRLKRGLAVILGDVGTGKTTLSRKLIQELKSREDCLFHMILDPSFDDPLLLLSYISKNFGIPVGPNASILSLRESLEQFLFEKAVVEGKTVALIVDEAQKLSDSSLENLRVLLNYETNEFKMLQLVLLGQLELQSKIKEIANFFDRISYKGKLEALDFSEMKEMIFFRIRRAGYDSDMNLFLDEALHGIHESTGGHPRQVTMLCHRALKSLLLKNKLVVDSQIIEELIEEDARTGWQRTSLLLQKNSY